MRFLGVDQSGLGLQCLTSHLECPDGLLPVWRGIRAKLIQEVVEERWYGVVRQGCRLCQPPTGLLFQIGNECGFSGLSVLLYP